MFSAVLTKVIYRYTCKQTGKQCRIGVLANDVICVYWHTTRHRYTLPKQRDIDVSAVNVISM